MCQVARQAVRNPAKNCPPRRGQTASCTLQAPWGHKVPSRRHRPYTGWLVLGPSGNGLRHESPGSRASSSCSESAMRPACLGWSAALMGSPPPCRLSSLLPSEACCSRSDRHWLGAWKPLRPVLGDSVLNWQECRCMWPLALWSCSSQLVHQQAPPVGSPAPTAPLLTLWPWREGCTWRRPTGPGRVDPRTMDSLSTATDFETLLKTRQEKEVEPETKGKQAQVKN